MPKEKIKILQVNKLYPPDIGGVETVVSQIAEGLNGQTDMKVLVCQKKGKKQTETINQVEIVRSASLGIVASMPVSLSFIADFAVLCKDRDLIQLHMPFPLGDLALLLSGYKGKVAVWWHSDIVRQKFSLRFYKPLMHWLLRRADRIIVASQGHIDGSEYLKPYSSKCVVIPFGIPDQYYHQSQCDEQKVQTSADGYNDYIINFLFVGRLVYYKGVDVLLKAFAAMEDKNTRLTIVGTGPLEQQLKTLALSLKISERVVFSGKLSKPDLDQAFADCQIFVLPSIERSEAFGLVQLEAMANGKPVINTDLPGGVPFVSLHEETGLTVPPADYKALAKAMDILAGDAEKRERYGDNGRKRVKDKFLESSMLKKIMETYNNLY